MTGTVMVWVYDHGRGEALPWVVSRARYESLIPKKEPEPMPDKNDYACADCGTEKNTMKGTCDKRGPVPIVLISVIEGIAGPNWRDDFKPNPDPVTKDHPEVKAAEEHAKRAGFVK